MQISQGAVVDETQCARRQCRQIVVHNRKKQALEIRNFTGDVEGKNLAATARCGLGAHAKAFGDQTALRGPLALVNECLVCWIILQRNWKSFNSRDVLRLDRVIRTKTADEHGKNSIAGHGIPPSL